MIYKIGTPLNVTDYFLPHAIYDEMRPKKYLDMKGFQIDAEIFNILLDAAGRFCPGL
jgi:hypothetical protein